MEAINGQNTNEFIPKAGASYNKAWDIIWATFVELLVVSIVYGVISIPTGVFQWKEHNFHWYFVPLISFGVAYGVFLLGPIDFGVKWVYLKAVRKEKINIKDMFSVFERNYWNAVLANLLVGIIVGFGFIMLIVPGIIFACRLAFVPYLVMDQKMDVMDALKTSWDMTKGHGWPIFFIGLLAIPIFIAGLIVLFFGVIISMMWISAAFAVIYYAVCLQKGQYVAAINGNQIQ
jgi:uncharacterized membrane protein